MSINIGPPSVDELRPRISVIGVGGAGGNAIANMIEAQIEGVDFIVANTDAQALNASIAEHRIQLGPDITRGLGAGARPEVGRAAAEETIEDIERALEGANMVFIAAGMGGGTGTGAAPVIAEIAREKGILTVGVVTKPFLFEGTRRMRSAESGIDELQKHVDTLLVIPNQNLFLVAKAETTFKEAFQLADEVLQQGVRSITDLMVMPGLINLDFADVRSVMGEMGKAMMGTGEGEGANRALEAAERAIANPLLDGVSMAGAKGVIISIIGGEDMRLMEVDEAANHIRELVDPEANIIWGSAFNPDLDGRIRVSVVATGIDAAAEQAQAAAAQAPSLSTARGPRRPEASAPAAGGGLARPGRFAAPATGGADAAGQDGHAAEPADDSRFGSSDEDGFANSGEEQAPAWANDDDAESGDVASSIGAEQEEEALELTEAVPEPEPAAASSAQAVSSARQDELLLDSDDATPAAKAPEPASRLSGAAARRPRMLASGQGAAPKRPAEPEPAPTPAPPKRAAGDRPAVSARVGGATLFERMAGLSRPARESQDEQEPEEQPERNANTSSSLRIPRFLGRQNNQ